MRAWSPVGPAQSNPWSSTLQETRGRSWQQAWQRREICCPKCHNRINPFSQDEDNSWESPSAACALGPPKVPVRAKVCPSHSTLRNTNRLPLFDTLTPLNRGFAQRLRARSHCWVLMSTSIRRVFPPGRFGWPQPYRRFIGSTTRDRCILAVSTYHEARAI